MLIRVLEFLAFFGQAQYRGQGSKSSALPTIALVAHYDSFGIVPVSFFVSYLLCLTSTDQSASWLMSLIYIISVCEISCGRINCFCLWL
jgi:hypothetical protein